MSSLSLPPSWGWLWGGRHNGKEHWWWGCVPASLPRASHYPVSPGGGRWSWWKRLTWSVWSSLISGSLGLVMFELTYSLLERSSAWLKWWRICLQCKRYRRCRFDPWVRKILWRRKWQPIPVFLPGKPHGWRSIVGYNPWGRKESDTTESLHSIDSGLSPTRLLSTSDQSQVLGCDLYLKPIGNKLRLLTTPSSGV